MGSFGMSMGALCQVPVHLESCSYIRENPVVADVDGSFQIVANCRVYLVVDSIIDPRTGTECASRFRSSNHGGLIVFDSLEGEPYSQSRPHWRGYPEDSPFVVTCAWSVPDTIGGLRAIQYCAAARLASHNHYGSRHPKLRNGIGVQESPPDFLFSQQ